MAKITGLRETKKKLSQLEGAVARKVLRQVVRQAGLPIVQQARSNIPVGQPPYESASGKQFDPYPVAGVGKKLRTPGFAKRNIDRKVIDTKRGVSVLVGVKPDAFYATSFIELGKSNVPAQPWLRPAIESAKGAAAARFAERLKRVIDRAAR